MVIQSIAADANLAHLIQRLGEARGVVHVTGLWGSSAPMVAAWAARATNRHFLYVTAHLEEADDARDDLELFAGFGCTLFPAWESLPGEGAGAREIQAERIRVCGLLARAGGRMLDDEGASFTVRPNSAAAASDRSSGTMTKVAASRRGQSSRGNRDSSSTRRPPEEDGKPNTAVRILVAPIQALLQPVPEVTALQRHSLSLRVGHVPDFPDGAERTTESSALSRRQGWTSSPDALLAWAVDRGFDRLDRVESPGDVARRGDIVDLFVPGEENPHRVQFDEDRVESIRRFSIDTQRSLDSMGRVSITAVPESLQQSTGAQTNLFEYLPADALIVLDHPGSISEHGRTLRLRLGETDRLWSVADLWARASNFPQLHFSRMGALATRDEDVFAFQVNSVTRFEGDSAAAPAELCRAAEDHDVHVFCETEGERQRLLELVQQGRAPNDDSGKDAKKSAAANDSSSAGTATKDQRAGAHAAPIAEGNQPETVGVRAVPGLPRLSVHLGSLHRGFDWTSAKTLLVGHQELFHRHRPRRRIRRLYAGRPLESWLDLNAGDYVVHVTHGICIFRGLAKLRKGESEQQEEFLTLEFADHAVIHVPCSQIDFVQKYIGAGGRKPPLSPLGGKRWGKLKQRAEEGVRELAESLLHVQALREQSNGTAYPSDTQWQHEFESAFGYQETEDQTRVAAEIRGDLVRPRPMDRVVCGDVGYGKTELAMRAVFKVVEYGRQAAVLVPTTVLAEQHFETFQERMAEYPFTIGCLSRFRGAAEQRKILEAARKGRLDIVIGTHRLLSKDVSFANLGLVVIDEEQRFGVEHKERLKSLRETVDVLTLTATPIPRTLHMALMGIRDISSLQTPPIDRRSIATQVVPFQRSLIRDAILREINRDGQVFFVHNFVQSLAAMADTVRSIVPEARVVHAHGQMGDDDLEAVMHRFLRREADVLVTTTIIESGIDIPSANTIFINRAERFGLADLHQLRGRVGRSQHRAYCYLLLSPDRPPTNKAAKRLKTIEEFSDLGAGFRIAMRDLEIRGAGDLLGKEQSGHIAAVGYEMYCRLLEQSVRRLKNEPEPHPPAVQIDLDVTAHVPREYIASDRLRIEAYRRVASCKTAEDLTLLERDLIDAFGPCPPAVRTMIELAEIRVRSREFGVRSISLRPPDVVFQVESLAAAGPLFIDAPGSVRVADAQTIHLRLPTNYLERATLVTVLRHLLLRSAQRGKKA